MWTVFITWNKSLQKSVMNFGSLIRFYWNHCIAITCVFKLGGVYMSISRRVKWNSTASILNIMSWNYRSEFCFCLGEWNEIHFCLRDRSETHFCLRDQSEVFFTPPPHHYPNPVPFISLSLSLYLSLSLSISLSLFCKKIIITIIPTDLVTNSLLSSFCPFL